MTIRMADRSDEPAIRDFVAAFYGNRAAVKYPKRWRWQFVDNPFAPQSGLPIVVAVDEGRVIGQLGMQFAPMWLRDRAVTCAWGVDFGVLAEFRGRGLGKKLQEKASQSSELFCSALMDVKAARLKQKLGFVSGGAIRMFRRFERISGEDVVSYLARKALLGRLPLRGGELLRSRVIARMIASVLVRICTPRKSNGKAETAPPPLLEEVSSFSSDCDELWDRNKSRYGVATCRTSEFLNWRYVSIPDLNYRKFRAQVAGVTVGVVIFRELRPPEQTCLRIVDLFGDGGSEALKSLLVKGMAAVGSRAPYVEMLTSWPEHMEVLRSLGFVSVKRFIPMASGRAAIDLSVSGKPGLWLITFGDQDCDQFRPITELINAPPPPVAMAVTADKHEG